MFEGCDGSSSGLGAPRSGDLSIKPMGTIVADHVDSATAPAPHGSPSEPVGRPRRARLYVVYWGALEPLGRALVLPAVKRLAALGARITLVTFDKPADLARTAEVMEVDGLARGGGRAVATAQVPQAPAGARDGYRRGSRRRPRCRGEAEHPPDVVHARTFVGGLIGLPLSRLTGPG